MPRANRLFGLEIDEISSVDRDANGYAQVVIAKRDRGEDEGHMAFYDAETDELIPDDELQNGDRVVNDAGEEFLILDDDTLESLTPEQIAEFGLDIPDDASQLEEYEDYEDPRLASVGKADTAITGGLSTVYEAGRRRGTKRLGQGMTRMPRRAGRVRNLGNGGAGNMVGKRDSLGDSIYETLSKALGDDERFEAISKAFGAVEARARAAEVRAQRAERLSKSLEDQRVLNEYIALAGEYNLPIDSEEFGQVLYEIGTSGISKRALDVLDSVFAAAADGLAYSGMEELGAVGARTPSGVMDMVDSAAREHVGKADVTAEQTVTALFDSHPELYDEYLREQQR